MADKKRYKKEIPFNGRLNTALDPAQVADNFTVLKNMRYKSVGIEPIGGMAKINTSAVSATMTTPTSAFHFRKSDPVESHLLVEMTGGSNIQIRENKTAIPNAGNFESGFAIYSPDSNSNGGRWAEAPNGMVAYANGKEACLYGGDEFTVGAFVTSSASVTNTATDPQDYTEWVRNDLTSSDNVVSLSGASYFLVGSPMPLTGVKFYLNSANATIGTPTVKEWTGTAWSALTVTDGTASGGATLAQDGYMVWASTESTSKIRMIYGVMLYWYQFEVEATCEIYRATLNAPFQTIKDIPDGIDREIYSLLELSDGTYTDKTIGVRANEYDSSNTSSFIEIDSLNSDDYLYCGFTERMTGLAVNVVADHVNDEAGSTLSVEYWDGTDFQSVVGTVDGTEEGVGGVEMVTNGDCSADSFTKGTGWSYNAGTEKYDCDGSQVADSNLSQSVGMTPGTEYRVAFTLSGVTAGTITPMCGTRTGDSVSNDGTYSVAISALSTGVLYFVADSNFIGSIDNISVKPLTETTFAKSGVITWAAVDEEDEIKTEISNSIPLYYYRLKFGIGTGSDTQVYYVGGVPTQKTIKDFDFPFLANDRLWLCKNNTAICSLAETANVFNGNDSIEITFGGADKLMGGAWLYSQFGASIYNITLFFKQNETWAVIGSESDSWQKYRVSSIVGCPAPGTIVTADVAGVEVEGLNRSVVIWQGANGVYVSDGRQPICISDDIEDRFDKRKATCMSQDLIASSQAFWDSDNAEYHWLFGVGSSVDTEMVYSLKKRAWYEVNRTSGKNLLLGVPVRDENGATYTYGLTEGVYAERLEYGTTMDDADITFELETGDIALQEGSVAVETQVEHHAFIGKAKTTTSNNISLTHYADAKTSGESWDVSPLKSGHRLVFPVEHRTRNAIFHRWGFSMTTDDETYGFEPLYFTALYSLTRDNTRDRR